MMGTEGTETLGTELIEVGGADKRMALVDSPLSDVKKQKVKQQMEFYFSASNLPRDKFLREQVAKDSEGFVDIALLCSFTRMAHILMFARPIKASDVGASLVAQVAEALQESDVLTVSEDAKRVRRTVPLPSYEEVKAEVDTRTLVASPFPWDVTLEMLTHFFRSIAPINCIRMRRFSVTKLFRGSIWIEFTTVEDAQRVSTMDVVFEGAPLHFEWAKAFKASKPDVRHASPMSPYKAGTIAANSDVPTTPNGTVPRKPSPTGSTEAAADDAGKESGPKEGEDGKAGAKGDATMADGPDELDNDGIQREPLWDPCCVIRFTFEEPATPDIRFGDVKSGLGGKEAGVIFVEYEQGSTSGFVRYESAAHATRAVAEADPPGTAKIKDKLVKLLILEGAEEIAFHERAEAARKAAGNRGRGRGRGRGACRGNGNKRHYFAGHKGGGPAKRGRRA